MFALGVALSLYVGILYSTIPLLSTERKLAPAAADKLVSEGSSFGVLEPPLADAVDASRPNGHELNATVHTADTFWRGGPTQPEDPDCLTRSVTVQTAPGNVRSGVLEVCVWPVQ